MREIKFRAWNEEFGEMCYSTKETLFEKREFYPFGIEVGYNPYPYEGWEVMQFTGLYDKNNVAIYEGDIVKFYHASAGKHTVGEIVYHKASFVAKFNYMKPEVICSLEVLRDCEVIGNIYENADLLAI